MEYYMKYRMSSLLTKEEHKSHELNEDSVSHVPPSQRGSRGLFGAGVKWRRRSRNTSQATCRACPPGVSSPREGGAGWHLHASHVARPESFPPEVTSHWSSQWQPHAPRQHLPVPPRPALAPRRLAAQGARQLLSWITQHLPPLRPPPRFALGVLLPGWGAAGRDNLAQSVKRVAVLPPWRGWPIRLFLVTVLPRPRPAPSPSFIVFALNSHRFLYSAAELVFNFSLQS